MKNRAITALLSSSKAYLLQIDPSVRVNSDLYNKNGYISFLFSAILTNYIAMLRINTINMIQIGALAKPNGCGKYI